MTSSENDYIAQLNNLNSRIFQYSNLVICIVGNLGNILSASVLLKKSWRKNVCVFYFHISLLISTVYLNCTILSFVLSGFNIHPQDSNVVWCKLFFYITLVASTSAPTALILASIDRLLISSQKVDTRLYSSKRLAYFSIGIGTCFWLLFHLHILIKINIQQFGPAVFFCYFDLDGVYQQFVSYLLVILNALFCLIMIVLSMFAFKNVRRIRAVPRQQRDRIRSMTKKDFQLIRCLFVQVIVYIVCTVGASGYSIYDLSTQHQERTPLQQAIKDFLSNTLNLVYFSYYASSFFILMSMSKAFRHELQPHVYKLFGQDHIQPRGDEQNQQDPPIDNAN